MTKGEAEQVANTLAVRLGPGWRGHVWENLGWHAEAVDASGRWKVVVNRLEGTEDYYSAFLGEAGNRGGDWADSAKTPEAAMRKVRKKAQDCLKRILKIVEGA